MIFLDCFDRCKKKTLKPQYLWAGALSFVALFFAQAVAAFTPFVVRDIRVEGVQRTEAGTVFNYLPIKVGDEVSEEKVSEAVKALYATGFFRDVQIDAQGDVLLIVVDERPTISALSFSGNKEFETDMLRNAMRDVGLSEGRIFDRSVLEKATQELKRQYVTRGFYNAEIEMTMTPQERNRVAISFFVDEGGPSKIARIHIVGSQAFTEKTLIKKMNLRTPGWFTWYTKNDQYSKQKLQADLEALRSFYQDQGYLEFAVESTQVSISPDKAAIDITVTVSEGQRYKISSVSLAGDLAVDESELRKLIRVRSGNTYSRARLQTTSRDIAERLGAEGYAFANVNAVPEINKEEGTVAFTFFIDPGRRVYVRKINISGNIKTRDEVIRREIRQMEGAWFDGTRVERSKVRIRRLGYFDDVSIETPPVPGAPDQIDVNISVVERNTGQVMLGIGYSSSEKIALQASISQQNVFGSGSSLTLGLNTSKSNQNYSLHFTDPYWTVDGISRTIELYKTRTDTEDLAVSYYKSDTLGAAVGFGVPITETDTINVGLRYENTKLKVDDEKSSQSYLDFVKEYGNTTNNFMLSAGWTRDTRDDIVFPSRGRLQTIYTEVAVPPGDLAYWKAQYLHQWFWPIYDPLVLMLRAELGYGQGYGGKPLPFFKAFYAGGVGSVRGYEGSSLGPRDKDNYALGGERKIVGNAEIFFPLIAGDRSVRGSVFFDVGQIYQNGKQSDNESFHYSTGVGVAWNSPIGAIKISYGYPIASKASDRIQRFQFQMGSVF
ncbi:MAG: outer membrane protein assembly factor BamA [Proteobacteria bacterium]|nr:outer membrane protein assembly factor BamA [Pseudomonadota bacterium]MCL2307629.1 outer membrane protein assembly factor BamA [Pseudomonadota bacterium]